MKKFKIPMALTKNGAKGTAYGPQTILTCILEMLRNAITACLNMDETRIILDLWLDEVSGNYVFRMADYGCGMDMKDIKNAFLYGSKKDRKAFGFSTFGIGLLLALFGISRKVTKKIDVTNTQLVDNNKWCLASRPVNSESPDVYHVVRSNTLHDASYSGTAELAGESIRYDELPEMKGYPVTKYGYPSTVICAEISPLLATTLVAKSESKPREALLKNKNLTNILKQAIVGEIGIIMRPLLERAEKGEVKPMYIIMRDYAGVRGTNSPVDFQIRSIPLPLKSAKQKSGSFTMNMKEELKAHMGVELVNNLTDMKITVHYEYGELDEDKATELLGPAATRTHYLCGQSHQGFDIENDLMVLSCEELPRLYDKDGKHPSTNHLLGRIRIEGAYPMAFFPMMNDKSGILFTDATWQILARNVRSHIKIKMESSSPSKAYCKNKVDAYKAMVEEGLASINKNQKVWASGSMIPYIINKSCNQTCELLYGFDKPLTSDKIPGLIFDWLGVMEKKVPNSESTYVPTKYTIAVYAKKDPFVKNVENTFKQMVAAINNGRENKIPFLFEIVILDEDGDVRSTRTITATM